MVLLMLCLKVLYERTEKTTTYFTEKESSQTDIGLIDILMLFPFDVCRNMVNSSVNANILELGQI
jgi:hypothetical protein